MKILSIACCPSGQQNGMAHAIAPTTTCATKWTRPRIVDPYGQLGLDKALGPPQSRVMSPRHSRVARALTPMAV